LGRALGALIDDPALRWRLGRAGHALARRAFDAEQNNRALLGLVADVARAGREARRAA
jgi:hypothetical protein